MWPHIQVSIQICVEEEAFSISLFVFSQFSDEDSGEVRYMKILF